MLNQARNYASPRLLIVLTVAAAALLLVAFFPALFRSETALQIRPLRQGTSLPDGFYVYQQLSAEGIRIKSITPEKDSLVIRFDSVEQSNAAEKVLRKMLPSGLDIARVEDAAASEWSNRISPSGQSVG